MDEKELYARIAARTGLPELAVQAVTQEVFAQAFAMAMEKPRGTLVVPHFATFRCFPRKPGGMRFVCKLRKPEELMKSEEVRAHKLASRRSSPRRASHRTTPRLSGEAYVPKPGQPPAPPEPMVKPRGFLARLLGLRGS